MIRPRVSLCVLSLFWVVATTGARSSASPLSSSVPRLRPLDHFAAMLLARGVEQSPTLRALVDRLARSDVIVYIEVDPKRGRYPGALRFVGATRGVRFVHIRLAHYLTIAELVGLLGHELHHAVEIADHPEVRDEESFRAFYRTHGLRGWEPGRYDTTGARNAGRQVRKEVMDYEPVPGSPSGG